MGLSFCRRDNIIGDLPDPLRSAKPAMVSRNPKYYYDVQFPTRPLHVALTSAVGSIDAYVTSVDPECDVKDISLNSKLIAVNGDLVEGMELPQIGIKIAYESLPMQFTLCQPAGLMLDEVPDRQAKLIGRYK